MTGQNVQMHGNLQILRCRPELVVVFRVKRQIRMRRLPDDRALYAGLGAALEFLYGFIDIVDGDRSDADQALRRHSTVFDQPVVISTETDRLELAVVHGEVRQQIGRKKYFGAEPVGFHFFYAARRIGSAWMGLKTAAHFQFWEARHLVLE